MKKNIKAAQESGLYLTHKQMGQIERRLSKTARKFLHEYGQITLDLEETVVSIRKNGCIYEEYTVLVNSKDLVPIISEIISRTTGAIRAFPNPWACLHEVYGLQ